VTNFAPPDWLRVLHPGVVQVCLGERETSDEDGSNQQVTVDQADIRPVAMRCDGCAGSYAINVATPRVFQCQYCNQAVGIPEEIWERMHPVKDTVGWYLKFESRPKDLSEILDLMKEFDNRYEQQIQALNQGRGAFEESGPSRFARMEISTKCPACEHPVPVNGPLPHVLCQKCGARVELSPLAMGAFMEWIAYDQASFDGLSVMAGVHFQTRSTRTAPSCERCEAALPLVEVGVDTRVPCTGCGATYLTFPVPEPVKSHSGEARQVYGTVRDPDEAWTGNAPGSLPFDCPSCGADFVVDGGTARIHHCEFCANDVFIPDGVWTKLHPVDRVRPWYVDAGRVAPLQQTTSFGVTSGNLRAMGGGGKGDKDKKKKDKKKKDKKKKKKKGWWF
jgi:hypothetical protein